MNRTLAELIHENPSRALLLDNYGINYQECLDKTIAQVCEEKGIDPKKLRADIASLGGHIYPIDFDLVSINFLIEYLISTHHDYAKAKLPAIRRVVATLARYDESHRELEKTFRKFSNQMRKHIILEEEVLFPFILDMQRLLENFDKEKATALLNKYSTEVLCHNHEHDEDEMHELRVLTKNFSLKEQQSLHYKIVMHELKNLQTDMEQHAKIEEDVLFKKAGQMEDMLRKKLKGAKF